MNSESSILDRLRDLEGIVAKNSLYLDQLDLKGKSLENDLVEKVKNINKELENQKKYNKSLDERFIEKFQEISHDFYLQSLKNKELSALIHALVCLVCRAEKTELEKFIQFKPSMYPSDKKVFIDSKFNELKKLMDANKIDLETILVRRN